MTQRKIAGYTDLIRNLIVTDMKLMYKNTLLGFMWTLVYPFVLMVVLYAVFSRSMRGEVDHYAMFLLSGIVFWGFFSAGTTKALSSISDNMDVIRRINFPRIILVISASLASLVNCLIELSVFMVLYVVVFKSISVYVLWVLPVLILEFLLVLGTGLILSSVYCFFRDLLPIWRIALQIGFFATPVFYPLSRVNEKVLGYYLLNPVTGIIVMARKALYENTPPSISGFTVTLISVSVILAAGYAVFRWKEHDFPKGLV
ncbi:MAG: ABC transporter permease [Elusimicrobia bacterium]|nr:ABC transporter permease [Elusimicrobiota bacterium]